MQITSIFCISATDTLCPPCLATAPYLRGTLVYSEGNLAAFFSNRSFKQALQILNDRLKTNKWLAGDEFSAADIMNVFVLTTVRLFVPLFTGRT